MNSADHNLESADFRSQGLAERAFRGSDDRRYRLIVWAFVLGSLSHLWLEDAAQPDWMLPNLLYVLGLVLLAVSRSAAGWALCALGLLGPLLFLRDQLTQSALFLMLSLAGMVFMMRRPPDSVGFVRTVRGLTLVVYAFAVWHKLNRDFFDPDVGCATYGFVDFANYYNFDTAYVMAFASAHAVLIVALELSIVLAYLLGWRRAARLLAIALHLPFTVTLAPAFAFVMLVGHVAFLTEEDLQGFGLVWKQHRWSMLSFAGVATAVSLAIHGAMPEWTMIPREAFLWLLLPWCALVPSTKPESRARVTSASRWISNAFIGAFVLNCSAPYLGLQYQHAAAMLSNLRIDRGCWNHFIVPESVRLTDDYLRVEEVAFGAPGRIPDYEQIVLTQLWSPPQLLQMRRNWCRPEVRPLSMAGSYRDRSWAIADLCDEEEPWPFTDDGVFGVELFDNALRFQKNLERACPQACIH